MGTKITVSSPKVSYFRSGYTTTIKTTSLGLEYGDDYVNILTHSESMPSGFDNEITAVKALISQILISQEEAAITAGDALASSITTVEADYKTADSVVAASVTAESVARVSADSALASDITVVSASVDNLDIELTDTKVAVAGQFAVWDGVSLPVVGNIKFIGGVQYQYLGGILGALADGWVRTDISAVTKIETLRDTTGVALSALQNQVDGIEVTGSTITATKLIVGDVSVVDAIDNPVALIFTIFSYEDDKIYNFGIECFGSTSYNRLANTTSASVSVTPASSAYTPYHDNYVSLGSIEGYVVSPTGYQYLMEATNAGHFNSRLDLYVGGTVKATYSLPDLGNQDTYVSQADLYFTIGGIEMVLASIQDVTTAKYHRNFLCIAEKFTPTVSGNGKLRIFQGGDAKADNHIPLLSTVSNLG